MKRPPSTPGIEKFSGTRHEVQHENGASTYYYLDTHLLKNSDEQIKIEKTKSGSLMLEIENHSYAGTLERLEIILWEWYNDA